MCVCGQMRLKADGLRQVNLNESVSLHVCFFRLSKLQSRQAQNQGRCEYFKNSTLQENDFPSSFLHAGQIALIEKVGIWLGLATLSYFLLCWLEATKIVFLSREYKAGASGLGELSFYVLGAAARCYRCLREPQS